MDKISISENMKGSYISEPHYSERMDACANIDSISTKLEEIQNLDGVYAKTPIFEQARAELDKAQTLLEELTGTEKGAMPSSEIPRPLTMEEISAMLGDDPSVVMGALTKCTEGDIIDVQLKTDPNVAIEVGYGYIMRNIDTDKAANFADSGSFC